MTIAIQSPAKYVQGAGELTNLPMHCQVLAAEGAYVLIDPFIFEQYGASFQHSFQAQAYKAHFSPFQGECSRAEVERQLALVKQSNLKVIVGIGGGKTLDTAKAVAFYADLPVVIMPTAASSDAPCSALSVLYTEEGQFSEYLFLKQNPNLVLVDTDIVAKAPVRLLVAGIGDALATYFEARANFRSNKATIAGGQQSLTAMALAELCYHTLLEDGLKAVIAAEQGLSSRALMNIVEANTYLSGIGFESGGLAAAHSIHNGLTVLPETHEMLHGEKVAFGVLCQLILENADAHEIDTVIGYCQQIGLPTCLADLGVDSDDIFEKAMQVAKATCVEGETIHNMPFAVIEDEVAAAILVADELGRG
ncbi:glycerol dehydrogenase [Pseudomonas sp. F1_0610]|uniref:glycerol dehydrogenase n=1 Tax=Pseudomonas sp. F1_0610 TaxID=3114284 RepID=UPI0039C06F45